MANTMYPAMVNSPKTELSTSITATDTTIKVVDATKLPKPPNLMTILSGDTSETLSYAAVSGNDLTGCVRGLNGTAKAWSSGIKVARTYTAYDHDMFIQKISEILDKLINATISTAGIVQLSNATDSTSVTQAATPKAISDLKALLLTLSGGTLSGNLGIFKDTPYLVMQHTPTSTGHRFTTDASGAWLIEKTGNNGARRVLTINSDGTPIWYNADGSERLEEKPYSGNGSPESVVSAPPGSIYKNKSGGIGSTFWVKESGGSGNTGWKAK